MILNDCNDAITLKKNPTEITNPTNFQKKSSQSPQSFGAATSNPEPQPEGSNNLPISNLNSERRIGSQYAATRTEKKGILATKNRFKSGIVERFGTNFGGSGENFALDRKYSQYATSLNSNSRNQSTRKGVTPRKSCEPSSGPRKPSLQVAGV